MMQHRAMSVRGYGIWGETIANHFSDLVIPSIVEDIVLSGSTFSSRRWSALRGRLASVW